MRSKRFFGASCTAQKMAEQCTLNRMYSRMNLHALEKRKFEYSLKKLKREKSFIDFLININVKASYTYLLLYAHEKQWISRCAHRHGSSIYRLLFKNYFYFWAQEALSCNGVCVNQNRAVFLDGYSNRRPDIVPVCFVENALLPWKRMIPGRFSALPFDLRQQANVFVHPCILNLSTFSSVFLFFFFEPPPRVFFDRLIAGYGKKCAKVLIFDKRSRGIWTVGAARRARLPICGPSLIYSLIYSDFCVLCASCRSFPPFLLSSLSSVILNIEFVWNCSNNDTRVTYI